MTRLGVSRCDEVEEAESRCMITSSVHLYCIVHMYTRSVIHIQVKGWGDHSVPDNTSTLLHSIRRVRDLTKSKRFEANSLKHGNHQIFSARFSSPAPVLVHCSAGVGRTGTWIAVYRLVKSINIKASLILNCFSLLLAGSNVGAKKLMT